MARGRKNYPETPDGRYFVSRGQLWRLTNPLLEDSERRGLIKAMMQGRRAMQLADDETGVAAARVQIDTAKAALGESGPVWWDDGAPDESRVAPENSSYREWWAALSDDERGRGDQERGEKDR